MRYQIVSDGTHRYCYMHDDAGAALTGTSNGSSFSFNGYPESCVPDLITLSQLFVCTNNGTESMLCFAEVSATFGSFLVVRYINYTQYVGFANIGPFMGTFEIGGWTDTTTSGLAAGSVIAYELTRLTP
jgi:hypothetical protein